MVLCIGMLVIPLVALGSGGGAPEAARAGRQSRPVLVRMAAAVIPAPADPIDGSPVVASSTTVAPATTVATTPTPTTSAVRRHVVTYARSLRSSTSTSAAPTTTTTAPPRPSQTGPASWYDAASGTCAHQTLPFGTVVTLVNLATGATASCTVDDRGPYEDNRIIDLSPDVFRQLAPLSRGVIDVKISW